VFDLGSAAVADKQWRMSRIELVNWGTFTGHHAIQIGRAGHLLTGGSGSGKSTLLDAIATVLVPRIKVRFNAAAAETSSRFDRTLITYVRGAWRRQTDDLTGEVTSDFLRGGATWSGVLLAYEDSPGGKTLTLIKLYHVKRGAAKPADVTELGIVLGEDVGLMDFQPFAKDGLDARGIKRNWPDHLSVTDQHSKFSARFHRAMGIDAEGAMGLLHRTQSAKALGSLDTLFRTFMLDRPETFDIAARAAEQFDELRQAHARVVEARQQVDHLEPLIGLHGAALESQAAAARAARLAEVIDAVRDAEKRRLAEIALAHAEHDLRAAGAVRDAAAARAEQAVTVHDAASLAAQRHGGEALARLENQCEARHRVADHAEQNSQSTTQDLRAAGIEVPTNAAEFEELTSTRVSESEAGTADAVAREQLQAISGQLVALKNSQRLVEEEYRAADSARSNLPPGLLAARDIICGATGLPAKALPFAGELMQVKASHVDWSGAMERVLRPLAVSLLVPPRHRAAVTEAVNSRFLRARVVLEMLPAAIPTPSMPRAANSLARRLDLAEGPFKQWLAWTLSRSYDYECAEDLAAFDAAKTAVTINGLVKRNEQRHEKDDRSAVEDSSRWVLGMDPGAKLERLLERLRTVRGQIAELEAAYDEADGVREQARRRRDAVERLMLYTWQDLDVEAARRSATEADQALAAFRATNADLRLAEKQRDEAAQALGAARAELEGAGAAVAEAKGAVGAVRRVLGDLDDGAAREEFSSAERTELLGRFEAVKKQRALTYETIDRRASDVAKELGVEREQAGQRASEARHGIDRLTREFAVRWPAAVGDLQPGPDDAPGFLDRHSELLADRLPEFEDRFDALLKSQSQRNIGVLGQAIRRAPKEIKERIREINASLRDSDFDSGRYLRIQVKESRSQMAEDFLRALSSIASDSLRGPKDRAEGEAKFEILRELMDRLNPANSDAADRNWREACLDTRRHVRFVGEEVDRAGMVVNVHDTSSGLSGGQQQKLAIFCLAAALRYQLASEPGKLPSYGTVVMDEAFDRADTDFTRMAMDVFVAFGFHMILATPLKALGALEDYVDGIGLVTCQDFKSSQVKAVAMTDLDAQNDDGEVTGGEVAAGGEAVPGTGDSAQPGGGSMPAPLPALEAEVRAEAGADG
jgi:uncharacterized protein YPO0396